VLHGSGFSRDKALRIPRRKPGSGPLPVFFLLRRHDVLPQRQSEDSKAQEALNAPQESSAALAAARSIIRAA
jgi:hypothetical protein